MNREQCFVVELHLHKQQAHLHCGPKTMDVDKVFAKVRSRAGGGPTTGGRGIVADVGGLG